MNSSKSILTPNFMFGSEFFSYKSNNVSNIPHGNVKKFSFIIYLFYFTWEIELVSRALQHFKIWNWNYLIYWTRIWAQFFHHSSYEKLWIVMSTYIYRHPRVFQKRGLEFWKEYIFEQLKGIFLSLGLQFWSVIDKVMEFQ